MTRHAKRLTVFSVPLRLRPLGLERFLETPVERLDQFAVMSVVKNHDTAGLLRSLVNSFMIAYSCPETADRAFATLLELEALRAELADARRQTTKNSALEAAANTLKKVLSERMLSTPFRILYGIDRLLVMADKPIQNLPPEISGFPVEFRVRNVVSPTTH